MLSLLRDGRVYKPWESQDLVRTSQLDRTVCPGMDPEGAEGAQNEMLPKATLVDMEFNSRKWI